MITFSEIHADPNVLGGKPCIKGTRISIEFILEIISSGASIDNILSKYPHLKKDQVQQAIMYAAQFNKNEILFEVKSVA